MADPLIDRKYALYIDAPGYPAIAAMVRTRVIITGPAASGKSALCSLLAGVTEENKLEEQIWLFGKQLDQLSIEERARRIGLVPSDPFLAFTGLKRTLLGELEMIYRMVFPSNQACEAQIDYVAEQLNIAGHLNRDPFTLSGGEAVRAALAMALIKRPELLVLDQMNEQLHPADLPHIYSAIAKLLTKNGVVFETSSRTLNSLADNQNCEHSENKRRWHIELRSLDAEHNTSEKAVTTPLHVPLYANRKESGRQKLLAVEGLRHNYPTSGFQLGPIDLDVEVGDRIALVGPNGSGKSTLLKCLALLESPSYSRMDILSTKGVRVSPPPEKQRHSWAAHALYCFQRPEDQLYLSTVREELAETTRRLGVASTFSTAIQIANLLGISDYLDRSPYDMPRSYRRLVPLAAALAVNPPLLLLDEPTVGLGDAQANLLIELLKELRVKSATIFVSHDTSFVSEAATHQLNIRELNNYQGVPSSPA